MASSTMLAAPRVPAPAARPQRTPSQPRGCPLHTLRSEAAWARRLRPGAFSALPSFLGDDADVLAPAHPAEAEAKPDAEAAAATAAESASEVAQLRGEVQELKQRMEELRGQLEQMNDRARERAVSLAEAVRAAGGGEAAAMEQLQHQQDDQLAEDENTWEKIQDTFTQVMSKGYIQSSEKIRDRLLVSEWELSHKRVAMRRGVAAFELHCASEKVDLPFETISQLYEEPDSLDIIADPHLRMKARACIRQATDEEYVKVWAHCTAEAQKLSNQFSNTEFLSKILPESGVLDALKKVVPMALKLVV